MLARSMGPSSYEQIGLLALIVQFTYPLIDLGLSHSFMAKRLDFNHNKSLYHSVSAIIIRTTLAFVAILGAISYAKGINIYLYLGYAFTLLSHSVTILPKINLLNTGRTASLARVQIYSSSLSFLVFSIIFYFNNALNAFTIYLTIYSLSQSAIIYKMNSLYIHYRWDKYLITPHLRFAVNVSIVSYLSAFFEHFITFLSNILILTLDTIGAFHLTRRAVALGANGIIDPLERTIYVSGGLKFFSWNYFFRTLLVSLILLLTLYFSQKEIQNGIIYLLGVKWSNTTQILTSGMFLLSTFPLHSYCAAMIKSIDKTKWLVKIEIIKKIFSLLSFYVYADSLKTYFVIMTYFSFLLLITTIVYMLRVWK